MKLAEMRPPKLRLPKRPATSVGAPATSEVAGAQRHTPAADPQLTQRHARLTEQFALMQSELGGLFYEMAIRDHVRLDVLTVKAAALQRVESELRQVDLMLNAGVALAGACPSCGAAYAKGALFCSRCATALPAS